MRSLRYETLAEKFEEHSRDCNNYSMKGEEGIALGVTESNYCSQLHLKQIPSSPFMLSNLCTYTVLHISMNAN